MSAQEDFKEELDLWESASKSSSPNLTIKYLEKYPSGYFNQLAEARLDELLAKAGEKKVQIKGGIENPFSKGTVTGIGKYFIGDTYTFESAKRFENPKRYTDVVTSLAGDQVIFNGGERAFDLLGNETKAPHPRFLNPIQFYPAEYAVGNKWSTQFGWVNGFGVNDLCNIEFTIKTREARNLDLGAFNAFFIEARGVVVSTNGVIKINYWIDPEKCYRPLEYFFQTINRRGSLVEMETIVLKSYKEKRLNSLKT